MLLPIRILKGRCLTVFFHPLATRTDSRKKRPPSPSFYITFAIASHARYQRETNLKMSPSKFTEILDPEHHTTSPRSDVRLEDIIAASEISSRGRTSSEVSSQSTSSTGSRQDSGDRTENQTKQRLSRLLSKAKK